MSRISSINRLPSEVREALHGWLRDPAVTQTEAAERTNALLDELAAQRPEEKRAARVSLSAVHRYDKRRRAARERVLPTRQVNEVRADSPESAPAGQLGHLINETLRKLVLDLASRFQNREIDEKSIPGMVEIANKMILMAQRVERASEIAARRERESKRQAAQEAAAKAKDAKRAASLGPERLREIVQ